MRYPYIGKVKMSFGNLLSSHINADKRGHDFD